MKNMKSKPNQILLSLLILFLTLQKTEPKPHKLSSSKAYIHASCRATTYPSLCIRCLSRHAATIHHNDHHLAQTALSVTLAKAKSTTSFVAKLTKVRGIKRREYSAVKDCIETLSDGIDRLAQSIKEMRRVGNGDDGSEFMWHMNNVQTWVSAALTDESTCLDGFSTRGMNGNVKVAIRRRIVYVAKVTSNALALVNRFASRHGV